MRLKRLAIFITSALVCTSAAADEPKLDLRQAVDLALSRSPDVDIANRTEANSRLTEKNAWSALLPSADLQANHAYSNRGGTNLFSGTNTDLHAPWSNSLGLSITENLYDNGDTWRAAEVATLSREVGALTLLRARQDIALKVARAFYDFSSAASSLEQEREQMESIRRQFRTIEGRYRSGVSSNRDYLRIKAQLQQAEIGLINQRVSLESALASLRQAVGNPARLEFLPYTPRPQDVEAISFPKVMPEQSLDFRLAKLQNKISDLRYRTTERQYWPRLSLRGSYSYTQPQYLGPRVAGLEDPYWDLRAGLVLDFNLWDWGIRRRNVEVADNQRGIENASQDISRITTTQELARLGSQVDLLKQSFRESLQILKANQLVYENVGRDYRDGKASYLDLISALNDLFASRSQILSLQFNLLKSRAELAYYQGNLDEILLRP